MTGSSGTADMARIQVGEAAPDQAAEVAAVIHEAFAGRPALDPPAPALTETPESVAEQLGDEGGLLASVGGEPVGALLMHHETTDWGESLLLTRVSVRPAAQHLGVARTLAATAEDIAARRGLPRVHLHARAELPATVDFWLRQGYREVSREGTLLTLAKELPVAVTVPTGDDMQALGRRLAALLRPGDLLLLTGDLGAGKTTLTQGLGEGLGVRGAVTSPTFVISRIHPGPLPLVHVDAYRLGGLEELDDLDLDVSLADSVTVVEWGGGIAEALAEDRLELSLLRSGTEDDETRVVRVSPVGVRWLGTDPAAAVAPGPVA
ncbi:tRNA (adenosine(37)-N6)-threonylcarbamoyltransferase complex ATPase subunit type 1 TsaE [Nocardioides marmoribigeumensis]|uniref:tRNA threonylcarbamoyladenosine biosynthesis protein TsaE n=1 Tax=Nocardioides marmoribigeumensis TaxID=433649 RepID=A0ABU2BZQ6_9ACTN|nr:tRNA (adenosine(37)-N6)-threonylcarbamoyltransferase complex ATPase subunit type 1 TsaE [Nocardioides marmoribigeumensis]MDR7363867.1 tRNA threonylcarbamoyladenosine biosynthesis protein TsaE [Nocardioides marmoribigeumensis]